MSTALQVLKALQTVISSQLNDYLEEDIPPLKDGSVEITFPIVDQMSKNNMVYIQPSYAEFEPLTTTSDVVGFKVSLFILSKKDTRENLTIKNHGYYEALCRLLRSNTELDGAVSEVLLNNVTFYPAVEANPNIVGAELELTLGYEKDYQGEVS